MTRAAINIEHALSDNHIFEKRVMAATNSTFRQFPLFYRTIPFFYHSFLSLSARAFAERALSTVEKNRNFRPNFLRHAGPIIIISCVFVWKSWMYRLTCTFPGTWTSFSELTTQNPQQNFQRSDLRQCGTN